MSRIPDFKDRLEATYSPKSVATYVDAAKHFIVYLHDSHTDESTIDQSSLTGFVSYLVKKGKQANSVRIWTVGAMHYCSYLHDKKIVTGPFVMPRVPSVGHKDRDVLTQEQLKKFVHACTEEEDPVATCLVVMALTGVRIGEAVRLKRDKIKVGGKDKKYVMFLVETEKSHGSKRTVPMIKMGNPILRGYMLEWLTKFVKRHGDRAGMWLFPSTQIIGQPVTTSSVQKVFRRVRDKLGISGSITPHSLRRTYATILSSKGHSDYTIKKLLGHTATSQATEKYVLPSEDLLCEAVETIL